MTKQEKAPLEEDKTQQEGKDIKDINLKKDTEVSIGDIMNEIEQPVDRTVPESALIKHKKRAKELEKKVKELEEEIANSGANKTKSKASKSALDELEKLAENYNVDKSFLKQLADINQTNAESLVSEKIQYLIEQSKQDKIDQKFKEGYREALKNNPQFKGIVDEKIIKVLSLQPENRHKTFAQVMDDVYGHLIAGKKTLNTTQSKTVDEGNIDYDRISQDTEYFMEIMKNPKLKKEYNDNLKKRLIL